MRRILAITTLILATGVMGTAQADIWRWKDAQGLFHYSDQWVPGSELIKANRLRPPGEETDAPRPAAPPSASPSLNQAVANADNQIQQQKAAREVQADVAKVREQQCKDAKERYDKAVASRRIYKTGKDGAREYLSEDDANALRVQAKAELDLACGSGK